jgi:hypothetical protein
MTQAWEFPKQLHDLRSSSDQVRLSGGDNGLTVHRANFASGKIRKFSALDSARIRFQEVSVAISPLPTLPLALIRAETSRSTSS